MNIRVCVPVMMVVSTALLFSGCGAGEPAAAQEGVTEVQSQAVVSVLELKAADAPVEVRFTAMVMPEEILKVSPQLPGKVVNVKVKEGDFVKAGDLLMKLDDEELKLSKEQAVKAHESVQTRKKQLLVASEIEEKSLELGIAQAQEALNQVKAKAKMIETGARPQERKQLQALVDMSKVRLESTKRELDRMGSLLQSEVIPKQSFEQVEDGHKVAEAQYRQALEQLHLLNLGARSEDRDAIESAVRQTEIAVEMARIAARRVETTKIELEALELSAQQAAVAVEMAELALGWTELRAPAEGRVEQVLVEEGAVVGAGIPAFVVMQRGKTEIQVLLREEERLMVKNGAPAEVSFDALPGEGPFPAKVHRIAEAADSATGLFPVLLMGDEALHKRLSPGMFVRGRLVVGQKPNALVVPASAVLRNEGKKVCYVEENGKAGKRYVETGQRYPDRVEVVSGLAVGERLIIQGHLGLVEGAAVRVEEGSN